MQDYADRVLRNIMTECGTLSSFNRFVLPLMRAETPELRHIAAEEARRRGYKANKEKGIYE